jgi:hypothetical protein
MLGAVARACQNNHADEDNFLRLKTPAAFPPTGTHSSFQ